MNIEDRVNFYLGELLYNQENIEMGKLCFIDDYKPSHKVQMEYYVLSLKKKIQNTNHSKKKISILFNDTFTSCLKYQFVKVRMDNKGVILKCLNFSRHWDWFYNKPKDINWNDKLNKIIWRGTTTGGNKKDRFIFIEKWYNKHQNIDVGFSYICQGREEQSKYIKGKLTPSEMLKYKYIVSIEGNDKDSGINWKLNSNSLVFMKKPVCCSWLMETLLIPNFHYILLNDDYSDLEEKLEWCENNQDKCLEIVKNANKFMEQFKDQKQEELIEDMVINKYFQLTNQ